MKKTSPKRLVLCFFAAVLLLLFCSKSSPLYPINDWADANIYFSIGKGVTCGQVMYRDLYDHKGPLLYALHALCALIDFHSFLGVFVMECLFACAFLYTAQALVERKVQSAWSYVLTAVLALTVYASPSFAQGDSAEELALPLIAFSLLFVWDALGEDRMRKNFALSPKMLIVQGLLAGCVFWIKFTMIGLQAGLLLALLIFRTAEKGSKEGARVLGLLIVGFLLSTLPWVVYFGVHHAIGDWLKTYLYDNLFLYSKGESTSLLRKLFTMVKCGLVWMKDNLAYSLFIVAGLAGLSAGFGKKRSVAFLLMTILGAIATFIGGKDYVYYGLVLAPAAIPAYGLIHEKWLSRVRCNAAVCTAICLCVLASGALLSPNPRADFGYRLGQSRSDTMQYRIARAMMEDEGEEKTLLNYGFMDAGFYTAASITPTVKYFHQTNVPLQEMLDMQRSYIAEGITGYVVTRGKGTPELEEMYELIATEKSPHFWYENVYLYRRK